MKKALKLVFDGQVFQPEEPVNLTPNTCYFAIIEKIEERPKKIPNRALRRIRERAMDLGIYDLARQHDHYLYGTDKR
jgi:hypothetical protein